jgi:hypothetical protein
VSVDAALAVLLSLVRENGARVGESITTDQLADAREVLDPTTEPYAWLERARGYSKTSDLAGMALALMVTEAPRRARLYGFGADREQAALLSDAAGGYLERTPELGGAFDVTEWKVTARHSGATLQVMASDASSTWGLRPWFVVVDELSVWESTGRPRRVWDAITSAMAKVDGSRLVTIMSAGDPGSWQYRLREHAMTDDLWYFHATLGPPPWADPVRVEEQRRRLLPSMFARLFECVWTEPEGRLATADDVRACVGHGGDLVPDRRYRYVVSLDVGLVRDRTVAVVAHGEQRPRGVTVVVDRVAVWEGTRARPVDLTAVEAWVEAACRDYRAKLVFDPYQAAHLTQRLRGRRVRLEPFVFSSASVARLAVTIFNVLRDRCLDLPDDDRLVDELCTVQLRETSPGVVRLDHDSDKHDDMAVTVAMAAAHIVEHARRPSPASMRLVPGGPISR